jgi:hypothetical protein
MHHFEMLCSGLHMVQYNAFRAYTCEIEHNIFCACSLFPSGFTRVGCAYFFYRNLSDICSQYRLAKTGRRLVGASAVPADAGAAGLRSGARNHRIAPACRVPNSGGGAALPTTVEDAMSYP